MATTTTLSFLGYPLDSSLSGTAGTSFTVKDFSTLPLTVTFSGTAGIDVGISVELDFPLMEVEGTLESYSFSGILDFPAMEVTGTIMPGVAVAGTINMKPMVVSGTIAEGGLLSGELDFPLMTIEGVLASDYVLEAEIDFPAMVVTATLLEIPVITGEIDFPLMRVSGTFQQVLTLYKGIAINLSHGAVTEYINFPVNSFCYYNGEYLAATSTGIYKLTGDKDGDDLIAARIKFHPADLGDGSIKRARHVWITYRSDGELLLTAAPKEGNDYEYDLPVVSAKASEQRGKIGKGIKDRFLALGLKNDGGCDFDLISFSTIMEEIKRRIR